MWNSKLKQTLSSFPKQLLSVVLSQQKSQLVMHLPPPPQASLSGMGAEGALCLVVLLLFLPSLLIKLLGWGICSPFLKMRPRMLMEWDKDLKGSIHWEAGLAYF